MTRASPVQLAPAPADLRSLNEAEARRALKLLADGTALQMADFFDRGPAYIAEMNRWTGGYLRTERPRRSDEAGLAAGRLFLCYLATGEDQFLGWATHLVDGVAAAVEQGGDLTHASMDLFHGLCWGANITSSDRWARAAISAMHERVAANWVESANRFVTRIGAGSVAAIEGLAWQAPLLAWAARREPQLRRYLERTLAGALEIGFIRPDGSSFHVAEFDGELRFQRFATYQGYSEASTWARGHAWGMHGFTAGWEATREPRFLEAARKMADWWLLRTGEDPVPHYDFDDPDQDAAPRDTCAAAIVADVLLRLARAMQSGEAADTYHAAADATLAELIRNHLSPGGVLLHGSSGRVRGTVFGRPSSRLPLGRAPEGRTHRFPLEEVMPFGNMFIVSALYRRFTPDWAAIDLQPLS